MGLLDRIREFQPVRRVDAGRLLERLLIWAVAAILILRAYLELTGYPQVGGRGLHIAHMLWGGGAMLVSVVLLLTFLGRRVLGICAILGGIGFGVFIDELGKFITSDNNYFFRPAIALIYIIFILLFLWFRYLERARPLDRETSLVNAVELLKQAVRGDLTDAEQAEALALLRRVDPADPVAAAITPLFRAAETVEARPPGLPGRIAGRARALYYRLVAEPWFPNALVVLFVLIALADLTETVRTIFAGGSDGEDARDLSFIDIGDLASTAAVGIAIAIGILRLRTSRLDAYRWFRRAILISIFFSQIFSFYTRQLSAVAGLAVDLLLLVALDYIIAEEEQPPAGAPAAATQALRT